MSLFAEVAGTAKSPAAKRTTRDAVIADLERLCTIRRGSLLLAPAYGIDDVTFLFHSYPVGMEAWQRRLEVAIAQYEPRLRGVRVVPLVTDVLDLTLRVEIHGTLVDGDRASPARFMATIDPQHRLSVR
jgi:type VI secretion system protein